MLCLVWLVGGFWLLVCGVLLGFVVVCGWGVMVGWWWYVASLLLGSHSFVVVLS